jgi:hypothetical protein
MATEISSGARNAALDAMLALFDVLDIYNGTKPTSPNDAPGTGSVLCRITLPATPFNPASGGSATKAGTWQGTGTAAAGAGTAPTWARFRTAADAGGASTTLPRCDIAAGITTGELRLNASIAAGDTVTINSYTFTQPEQ